MNQIGKITVILEEDIQACIREDQRPPGKAKRTKSFVIREILFNHYRRRIAERQKPAGKGSKAKT